MHRRFIAKNPDKTTLVVSIFDAYPRMTYVGVLKSDTDLSKLTPAPLPGDCGRAAWKSADTPSGPVGLLLQHTHLLGGALAMKSHTIAAHNRIHIHYFDLPFQLLHSTICQFAFDQVHIASSRQRTVLQDSPTVAVDAYRRAMRNY